MIVLGIVLIVLLALIAPFVAFTPHPPKPDFPIRTESDLDRYLENLVRHETPPALDITVMKGGAVVYAKAFGLVDPRSARSAAPGDVYHYWSVTKLFTATAIMQLTQDGRLGLEDPVTKYLPEFMPVGPKGEPEIVTIRQLLNHRSGMKNLGPADLLGWIHQVDEPATNQVELVRSKLKSYQKLSRSPDEAGAYSNAAYIVLGAVVARASGESYEDFVRSRILTPLGMKSTDFVYRPDLRARAVAGSHPVFHVYTPLLLAIHHDWFSKWVDRVERRRMWLAPLYTDYTGPTGLIGTGADLARFGQAFLGHGELGGQRILSPALVDSMLNEGYGPNDGPDRDRMGLGWHWWNAARLPFKGHGGDGPGFGAQLAIFPEQDMVVVVLANDTLIDRVGLAEKVAAVFGG
jgi:CubicO group peptidase (beta-lactamase class C family)